MNRKELQQRTKKFHVDIIKLCGDFPRNAAGFETAKQLIRSAGSVGANYRATSRAKSDADFIYKIEIVLEEADELHVSVELTTTYAQMCLFGAGENPVRESDAGVVTYYRLCKPAVPMNFAGRGRLALDQTDTHHWGGR